MQIEISRMADFEIQVCAQMMVANDPWKAVGRSLNQAITNFSTPQHSCYSLKVDGNLEGFLVLILNGFLGGGFIKSIMVSEKYQGQGVGGQLLDFAEQQIFSRYANAYICVSSFNEDAKRLYLRRGFKVVANLEQLIVAEHDELLLRKTLGPTSSYQPG